MKKALCGFVIVATVGYNLPLNKEAIQMAGAYRMLSQVLTVGAKDTTVGDIRQLKIFTPDYMMYANVNKTNPDSVSSFGIGPYSITGNKVTESVIYSASGRDVSSEKVTFSLDITQTTKGFKQFISDLGPSDGRKVTLTEEYERVGSEIKSPLDGAWKQVKAYTISGKDTTMDQVTQFKTYYAGYFIWGSTYKDSTNKNRTGIGFGTFKSNGNNKIKETIITSTFSILNDQTIDIDIKMNGNDEYQQTSAFTPRETRVEIYERLKK